MTLHCMSQARRWGLLRDISRHGSSGFKFHGDQSPCISYNLSMIESCIHIMINRHHWFKYHQYSRSLIDTKYISLLFISIFLFFACQTGFSLDYFSLAKFSFHKAFDIFEHYPKSRSIKAKHWGRNSYMSQIWYNTSYIMIISKWFYMSIELFSDMRLTCLNKSARIRIFGNIFSLWLSAYETIGIFEN